MRVFMITESDPITFQLKFNKILEDPNGEIQSVQFHTCGTPIPGGAVAIQYSVLVMYQEEGRLEENGRGPVIARGRR